MNIIEQLHEENPHALLAHGFDKALIGIGRIFNKSLAVYDTELCIKILMKNNMTYDEALEYFEYNVLGSYMGENTPIFMEKP